VETSGSRKYVTLTALDILISLIPEPVGPLRVLVFRFAKSTEFADALANHALRVVDVGLILVNNYQELDVYMSIWGKYSSKNIDFKKKFNNE
jgi:hypothetical protein